MATTNSSFYLSEQLIFEILSWLPVTSLLRFESVCKLWFIIISSPQFVEAHLNNSKKKHPSLLSVFTYHYRKHVFGDVDVDAPRDDVYIDSHVDADDARINLPVPFSGTNQFIGSCNGLVFLVNFGSISHTLYLWNPLINLFKRIPTPKKESKIPPLDLGFGFDSISNDYKILRIVSHDYDKSSCSFVLVAQLYSAKADSWKEIEVPETLQDFQICPKLQCVPTQTGVLYVGGIDQLLSFDLHNEVFRAYQYPKSLQYIKESHIFDFEGSVAMIFESCRRGSVLELWTLDDVCGNWTKSFNLEANFKMDRVVLYLGGGRFVVKVENDKLSKSGCILYDHKKKETQNFPPPIPIPNGKVRSLVKYTESLVLLEGFVRSSEEL